MSVFRKVLNARLGVTHLCHAEGYNHDVSTEVKSLRKVLAETIFRSEALTRMGAASIWGWLPGSEEDSFDESVSPTWRSEAGAIYLIHVYAEKTAPKAEVKRRLAERCLQFTRETGKKPGRKLRAEMKEQIEEEILASTIPRVRMTPVIWTEEEILVFSTTTKTLDSVRKALLQIGVSSRPRDFKDQIDEVKALDKSLAIPDNVAVCDVLARLWRGGAFVFAGRDTLQNQGGGNCSVELANEVTLAGEEARITVRKDELLKESKQEIDRALRSGKKIQRAGVRFCVGELVMEGVLLAPGMEPRGFKFIPGEAGGDLGNEVDAFIVQYGGLMDLIIDLLLSHFTNPEAIEAEDADLDSDGDCHE